MVSGDVFKVMGASLVQRSGVAARVAALRCARLALTGLVLRDPVPSHTGQITGMHVCMFPPQVNLRSGTGPPPRHAGH